MVFKMNTYGGKWIITHGTNLAVLDSAREAFLYISLFTVFRKHKRTAAEPYPVRSLIPNALRGC